MDTPIERATAGTTARLAAASGAAATFWTAYRTPILIGLVTAIIGFGVYYWSKREGFTCQQPYDQRYPQNYPQGYQPGYQQSSPYDLQQSNLQDQQGYPRRTLPEGFYAQMDPQTAPQGVMMGPKKVVLFYAPWCPHCQSLMDDEASPWQIFRRKHSNRPDLSIDQVNCDEKPEAATKYGIGGFPTIMLFQGDKSYTYDGDRSLESLERFVESPIN